MVLVSVWFLQLRKVGGQLSADVEVALQGIGGLLQSVGGLWKRLVGCFPLGCRNSSEPVDLLGVAICGPSCRGDVVKEGHDMLLEVSGWWGFSCLRWHRFGGR